VRKLNFVAFLSAFKSIADKDFEKVDYTKYFSIPENQELLFDLLLRNITLTHNMKKFKIDIGINRKKYWDTKTQNFFYKGTISELGDLSIFRGIEEYDMSGYQISSTHKLAVDESADFILEGKFLLKIENGFFTDSDRIKSILNGLAIG
jgi:hypothetical protein